MPIAPAPGPRPLEVSVRRPASLCGIAGLGYYLPEQVLTNDQLAQTVDTSDQWIIERTGIRSRHRVDTEMATSDIAWRASVDALADAGLTPPELDLILVATATPDQPVPSTGCFLQNKLGTGAGVPAMDVAAGCAGFGYALQMAAACIKAGMHRRILVVGADCLTRITNYADRQSCILFGDGAGAVVVTPPGEGGPMRPRGVADLLYTSIGADGGAADLIQIKAGGSREPASADSVAGARHTLELRGREVFKTAVRQMSECIQTAAAAVGVSVHDFDLIVPHQANARIIESVGKQLGVAEEKVVIDIAETGNMASASIPVALGRARRDGRLAGRERLVVVVGFGAGTTWACQVLAVRGE